MKRKAIYLILTIICGVLIFLTIWLGKLKKQPDNYKRSVTPEAVSSESIITVKDEKEERTLYWGNPDLNHMGVCADYLGTGNPFASNYSQVLEGHYYYLRHILGEQYIIYQDEGKTVGKFNIDGDMEVFLKYKDEYYVSYYSYDDGEYHFSRIDTGKEIDAISRGDSECSGEIPHLEGSPLWLYDDYIFYYPAYRIEEETGIIYINNESDVTEMIKAPLNNLADITKVKIPDRIIQNYPDLVFADGKIFYGEEDGGVINLYSYDMETNTELKFFSFQQKKRRIKDKVKIQFDQDYIYCGEYLIPLSGGAIQIIDDKNKKIDYSYNDKYIYYIDEKFYVHQIDKKTMKNNIISQIKAMKVDATDQAIYVQRYNKDLFEDTAIPYEELEDHEWDSSDWDWYSCALYKMDLDGGNIHKIADKVTEKG